tara:strand:+ start:82 stop:843 length:762 start_codon:yes stop_codon:yes gene_type:complete
MKYIHEETVHNLKDPEIIIPKILEIISPKSVVDIGCGIGTFLNVFNRYGISNLMGLDGHWVDKSLLLKNIRANQFREIDLEKEFSLEQKYDLVVSLEVAEHLSKASASNFVKNLVNAGEVILFSAAIPNQGGQNHLNEQPISYWNHLFLKHNYVLHDVLRPIFWNTEIQPWYKQNMVFYAPKGFKFNKKLKTLDIENIVHPEIFKMRIDQLNYEISNVYSGNITRIFALKILIKSIIGIKFWSLLKKSLKTAN